MLAFDSNILLYAFVSSSPWHRQASAFIGQIRDRDDVVLSELVLVEFYTLLRNPAVLGIPLSPPEAVEVIQVYRSHPRWRLEGFAADSLSLHDNLWRVAGVSDFARRRIYDIRLGLSLLQQGVTELATANVADFVALDFKRVWNPLT